MSNAADNVKVLGKIEAERPCDCCGNRVLKTAVVIEVEGLQVHYGRDCAGAFLYGHGVKSSAASNKVDKAVAAADHAAAMAKRADEARLARVSDAAGRGNALRAYIGSNRPMDSAVWYVSGDKWARVDSSDAADVAYFVASGYDVAVI